jgi:hypothetical protein
VTYVRCVKCAMITEGPTCRDVRLCLSCRRHDMEGDEATIRSGRVWSKDGVPFVRCLRCDKTGRAPEDKPGRLCLLCYREDVERERDAAMRSRMARRRKKTYSALTLIGGQGRQRQIRRGHARSRNF